jgi:hypothetical protein
MGTTNDRDNQQWGQPTMGTTNNGERQTTGNNKQQGTTNNREQRMTGSSEQQGTMNSREQRMNKWQQDHPRYKREMVGLFSFSFSFSNFHSSYTALLRATAHRVFMYLSIPYT